MKINFNFKSFLGLLLPFVVTQVLGLYAAWRFLPDMLQMKAMGVSDFGMRDLIVSLIFLGIILFVAIKFKKIGAVFYKVLLTILILSGVQGILGIWLGALVSSLIAIIFIIAFWLVRNVAMQNLAMVLTLASIGAILGLTISPELAVIVLIVLSFYDILAVYKTRHMIAMAQGMLQSGALFGFIIPRTLNGFKQKTSVINPGNDFMILGSGDVVLPLLLVASLVRYSLGRALVVVIFSVMGLLLMNLIFNSQEERRPMAALPPIALMAIIGYFLGFLII